MLSTRARVAGTDFRLAVQCAIHRAGGDAERTGNVLDPDHGPRRHAFLAVRHWLPS